MSGSLFDSSSSSTTKAPTVGSQTSDAPAASLNVDGYKSNQDIVINQTLTDLGALEAGTDIAIEGIYANRTVSADAIDGSFDLAGDSVASLQYIAGEAVFLASDVSETALKTVDESLYLVGEAVSDSYGFSSGVVIDSFDFSGDVVSDSYGFSSDALIDSYDFSGDITSESFGFANDVVQNFVTVVDESFDFGESALDTVGDSLFVNESVTRASLDAIGDTIDDFVTVIDESLDFGKASLDAVNDSLFISRDIVRESLGTVSNAIASNESIASEALFTADSVVDLTENLNEQNTEFLENTVNQTLGAVTELAQVVNTGGESITANINKMMGYGALALAGLIAWRAMG